MIHRLILTAVTIVIAYAVTPSMAQEIKKLNSFGEWTALSISDPSGKICYASSEPHTMEPTDRKHGMVLFFVTNRPKENINNEPSVTVGYEFKRNSEVSADIDGTVFKMVTDGDSAWLNNKGPNSEAQMVEALKTGQRLIVSGESQRGTKVKYTFSLSGVTAAIKEIDSVCPLI